MCVCVRACVCVCACARMRVCACSYPRKIRTFRHKNESGTNHPNVNESGTSHHIQEHECKLFYNPLILNDSFLFTFPSVCQKFNSSKAKHQPTQGTDTMHLNIHEVVSVELEKPQDFKSFTSRVLIIRDANGNKYEITLFAKDADALQIKA